MKTLDSTLAEEIQAYAEKKAELLSKHAGKFVVFKHHEQIGPFDTYDEAFRAGLQKWGIVSMLVKRVEAQEPTVTIPTIF